MTDINFSSRETALQTKPQTSKNLLPFVTTHSSDHWHLITDNRQFATIFPDITTVAYKEFSPLRSAFRRSEAKRIHSFFIYIEETFL